jgi:hypothetical protein
MKIRAGPQPFVQTIFIFLSAAKSDKFLVHAETSARTNNRIKLLRSVLQIPGAVCIDERMNVKWNTALVPVKLALHRFGGQRWGDA